MPSASCTATCAGAGFVCGNVCGALCGACAGADVCFNGVCLGPSDVSCLDCSLRVVLLAKQVSAGQLTQVTLGIDYLPVDSEPRPRMADFRLVSTRPVTVVSAAAGSGLVDMSKDLYRDPATQDPWRQRADGTIQFVALSLANTHRIGSGRLLTATLNLSAPSAAFRIQKRPQTFAPPEADQAIFASTYDRPLVVVP